MFEVLTFLLGVAAFYSVYLMLSISLNLEYGYAGISNFGKVMFFAGGAFTTGALLTRITALMAGAPPSLVWEVSKFRVYNTMLATRGSEFFASNPLLGIGFYVLMVLLGACIGALLGVVASYPAIRLREDYLGMTLIVSGELLRVLARNYEPLICGTLGVSVPNPFAWARGFTDLVQAATMMSLALLTWYAVERLVNSPYGRALRALRDSEIAAMSLGKDVVRLKMYTLAVGSAIAGAAGSMYAMYMGAVLADEFMPLKTFVVWLMVVMGGTANNYGAGLGALAYLAVDRTLTIIKHWIPAPFDVNYLSYVMMAILLLAILMFKPEGLIPEKPGRVEALIKGLSKPPHETTR